MSDNKVLLNLENTVQALVSAAFEGVKIKWIAEDSASMSEIYTKAEIGDFVYCNVTQAGKEKGLWVITKAADTGRRAKYLGEFPRKGDKGDRGDKGATPLVAISPNNTWIINGVDTGKPSRGIQGATGTPGYTYSSLTAIDASSYTPSATAGATMDTYTTQASASYTKNGSTVTETIQLKYKVPKGFKEVETIGSMGVLSDEETMIVAYNNQVVLTNDNNSIYVPLYNDEESAIKGFGSFFENDDNNLIFSIITVDCANGDYYKEDYDLNHTVVQETGSSTTAVMSQNAVTTALNGKQNSLNSSQLAAVNSGITATKVGTYDGYSAQISDKYTKPASGIPSTDMTTAVQTSLGKADTALQASALNDYSTTTQMNTAIAAHHDSTKQDTLTAGSGIDITGTTISCTVEPGGDVFVATYGTTTHNDIKAASLAGKAVVCLYSAEAGNRTYTLSNVTNNACVFTAAFNPSSTNYMQLRQLTVTAENDQTATTVRIERQSNRVNQYAPGEAEAYNKYPSCECMENYINDYASAVYNHKIKQYAYEPGSEAEQVTDYAEVMFSIQDDYEREYEDDSSLLEVIQSRRAIAATGTYHQEVSTTATRQIIQVHYNETDNKVYATVIGTNGQGVFGIEDIDITSSAQGFSIVEITDTVTKFDIVV